MAQAPAGMMSLVGLISALVMCHACRYNDPDWQLPEAQQGPAAAAVAAEAAALAASGGVAGGFCLAVSLHVDPKLGLRAAYGSMRARQLKTARERHRCLRLHIVT